MRTCFAGVIGCYIEMVIRLKVQNEIIEAYAHESETDSEPESESESSESDLDL